MRLSQLEKSIVNLVILFITSAVSLAQFKGIIPEKIPNQDTLLNIPADLRNRLALVVGNAAYNPGKLNNPVNDANAIAGVLEQSGFKVIRHTNTNLADLRKIIDEFGDSIKQNPGVSLFYYSGHGLQFDANNYMLPLNAQIETANDILIQTVAINNVFKKMKQVKGGLNIILLDACRNNVFTGLLNSKIGLSSIEKAPENTYIFYATSPDAVALDGEGDNSPFTNSFVEAVRNDKDSVEIFQVVKNVIRDVKKQTKGKQIPWIVGSPEMDFYFKKSKKTVSNLYVLSVGISEYKNFARLNYPAVDATEVGNIFRQSLSHLYDKIHITTLVNEPDPNNIMLELLQIRKQAKSNDFIIFYFSGFEAKYQNRYFLVPAHSDADNAHSNMSFDNLLEILAEMPCKAMFINDAIIEGDGKEIFDAFEKWSTSENGLILFLTTNPRADNSAEDRPHKNGIFVTALKKILNDQKESKSAGMMNLREFATRVEIIYSRPSLRPIMLIPEGMSLVIPNKNSISSEKFQAPGS